METECVGQAIQESTLLAESKGFSVIYTELQVHLFFRIYRLICFSLYVLCDSASASETMVDSS